MKGYIYIMQNPAMPDLVKIGFSTKDPTLRARDLNGTGVPHAFDLVYEALIDEPRDIEQAIHSRFRLAGLHEAKEFFRLATEDAVGAVQAMISDLGVNIYYERSYLAHGDRTANAESAEPTRYDQPTIKFSNAQSLDNQYSAGNKRANDNYLRKPNPASQDARSAHPNLIDGTKYLIPRSAVQWDSHFPHPTSRVPPSGTIRVTPGEWPNSNAEGVLSISVSTAGLTQLFDASDIDVVNISCRPQLDFDSLVPIYYGRRSSTKSVAVDCRNTNQSKPFGLKCAAKCLSIHSLTLADVSVEDLQYFDGTEARNLWVIIGDYPPSLEVFSLLSLPLLQRLHLSVCDKYTDRWNRRSDLFPRLRDLGYLRGIPRLAELYTEFCLESDLEIPTASHDLLESMQYVSVKIFGDYCQLPDIHKLDYISWQTYNGRNAASEILKTDAARTLSGLEISMPTSGYLGLQCLSKYPKIRSLVLFPPRNGWHTINAIELAKFVNDLPLDVLVLVGPKHVYEVLKTECQTMDIYDGRWVDTLSAMSPLHELNHAPLFRSREQYIRAALNEIDKSSEEV